MNNKFKKAASVPSSIPVPVFTPPAPVKEIVKTKKQTVNLPEHLWKQLIQHKLDTNENFQTVCVKALTEYLARQS